MKILIIEVNQIKNPVSTNLTNTSKVTAWTSKGKGLPDDSIKSSWAF